MAVNILIALLTSAYLLVPNSHHVLLGGIPLSLVGTMALVLALAHTWLPGATRRTGTRVVVLVGIVLLGKGLVGTTLPSRGFTGSYFANGEFEGAPYRATDVALNFNPETFRREFFNEHRFRRSPQVETLPFSVVWRGFVAFSEPTTIAIEAAASEPVTIAVDGGPVPSTPLVGVHEVIVSFARRTAASPSLSVALMRPGGPADPVPVFAGAMTPAGVRFLHVYTWVAIGVDLLLLLFAAWRVGIGIAAALAARPERWLPPLRVAGFAVVLFWIALGAARTGPNFATMEFLDRGDDWFGYEATARAIATGDLTGGGDRTSSSSFFYPYFLAMLHILFGDRHWPIYFAQYLMLGLACVALGAFGKKLWGERAGLGVILTATVYGLLDVSRWYSVRFLSENLVLLMIPLAFLATHAYLDRPRIGSAALAGALLAGLAQTRTSLLPFAGIAVTYLALRRPSSARPAHPPRWPTVALVSSFVFTFALLPLREYIASGTWTPLPGGALLYLQWFIHQGQLPSVDTPAFPEAGTLRGIVLPNIPFMLGYPKFLEPAYSIRPHWFLLWVAYFAWAWSQHRKWPPPIIGLLHVYVVVYVGFMSVFAFLFNYGFRHLLALFFLLCLFFPVGAAQLARRLLGGWHPRSQHAEAAG